MPPSGANCACVTIVQLLRYSVGARGVGVGAGDSRTPSMEMIVWCGNVNHCDRKSKRRNRNGKSDSNHCRLHFRYMRTLFSLLLQLRRKSLIRVRNFICYFYLFSIASFPTFLGALFLRFFCFFCFSLHLFNCFCVLLYVAVVYNGEGKSYALTGGKRRHKVAYK